MSDQLELLRRALDQVSSLLGEVRPDQVTAPTPCPDWDVSTLARHIVFDLEQFQASARGTRPDWSGQASPIEGDWRDAFDLGAADLMVAWHTAGDLGETVQLPMGEVPRSFLVNQQISEFAVHGWDLARAIGHTGQLDDAVAEQMLPWAQASLRPEFRGPDKAFGAEVASAPDAPAPDRLAAYFGRSPDWIRPS